ncbi:NAD(P)-dependent alcohol dehydrogenase [Halioxenophilus sp. WMMB6]|uniref:NAD(P)-dependent alcohol dehydrogenase n=1 Tax=Halioxenophilus sp. WMMB6 TaxID=3073815 RepID=UPI00295E8B1A|nr:NAD(P)-dependent alcohol dehydrogenase [Halioxenophilus sp. WMMB6]
MKSIEAAVLRPEQSVMVFEHLQLEPPKANEVLVKIVACGICHTDMVLRDAGLTPRPVVLGHEGSGIVESVGPGVSGFKPGDRVAISFASCGGCPACGKHAPSYCQQFLQLNFLGARGDGSTCLTNGDETIHSHIFGQSSFATHAVCPVSNLVKVDDEIPLELVGPFGCGFQTGAGAVLNSLKVSAGSTVMVLGAGAVGLSAVAAAVHIAQAATVIALDLQESRLALAKEVGATHTLAGGLDSMTDAVRALLPQGVDYIIDTTGYAPLLEPSVALLANQGTLALVASYSPNATLTLSPVGMMMAGKRIIGVMEGDSDIHTFIPALLEHFKKGRFPVDKLVRYYDFHDLNSAIDDAELGVTIKAIVTMPK